MLPLEANTFHQGGRMIQVIETAPEMHLTPQDIDDLLGEVEAYHGIYEALFQRREQRERSQDYLYGLLSPEIVNKNVETMVLALKGDDQNEIRAMQHFISEGGWKDLDILKQHWHEVSVDLGEEEGVFTLDGSDFPKQGTDSVGVKRQHCGELGKTANCQAGVFLGYASSKGYMSVFSASWNISVFSASCNRDLGVFSASWNVTYLPPTGGKIWATLDTQISSMLNSVG